MAASHNAERAAKSACIKVVKMALSEDDIQNAALDRLRDIRRELESALPTSTVFLADIAEMFGFANSVPVLRRAKNLGIKLYTKRRDKENKKNAACVSEEDGEKIIRSFYENV